MATDLYSLDMVGDVAVLTLRGNIGSLIGDRGLQPLLKAVLQPGIKGVVVDFEQLGYFGSSVLEALRHIWSELSPRDGRMSLCCVSEIGREILHVARFDTLWPVCATREEALASVRAPAAIAPE